MNIFIVGDGSREHAITYMLKKSEKVDMIYSSTKNYGINSITTPANVDVYNFKELRTFIKENNIELVVVGPEQPLVAGITNAISDITKVFGPTKEGAQLEGSKVFSKDFMLKYDIPTAKSEVVTTFEEAKKVLVDFDYPHVIKVDGLAGGKGVLITNNEKEDKEALDQIFLRREFGNSADRVIIEEFLDGNEFSAFYLIDNNGYKYFSTAVDYKRAYDNNLGPNTGGMGTLAPYNITESQESQLEDVARKTFEGIKLEGIDFRGVVFIGFMNTKNGLKVLEYNVRFGDPETQSMLVRLKTDLFDVLYATASNKLNELSLEFYEESAVCVVVASEGYPNDVKKGREVSIKKIDDVFLFIGGVAEKDNKLITTSGRVASVVARGQNLDEARKIVFDNIDIINFDGSWYRKDI